MDYNQVEVLLAESSGDDWIKNDELGVFTYKKDLSLRIERVAEDREFVEPWATKFPDKNARAIEYRVYYNNSFVDERLLVSVDGARAILPLPKSAKDLIVKKSNINFARIVNTGSLFDNYLKQSEFKEED